MIAGRVAASSKFREFSAASSTRPLTRLGSPNSLLFRLGERHRLRQIDQLRESRLGVCPNPNVDLQRLLSVMLVVEVRVLAVLNVAHRLVVVGIVFVGFRRLFGL